MRIHRHAGVLEPSMDTLTPAHRQQRCGDPSVTMFENNPSPRLSEKPPNLTFLTKPASF
jgi:hypothetical protein